MNSYQRLTLINEIAYKLQQEMTTREINILLAPYNLKGESQTSVISKRLYVQDLLKKENVTIILQIAKDIEIDVSQYQSPIVSDNINQSVWLNKKRKVFISHLSKDRQKASALQYYLLKNDISAFVAHEDIEPNQDWQNAIEYALKTMDLLIAIITPGYFSSPWTNQEIGYALGLNKKVIVVKVDEDPKGFIGRYQAINGKGRLPKDITIEIMRIINPL